MIHAGRRYPVWLVLLLRIAIICAAIGAWAWTVNSGVLTSFTVGSPTLVWDSVRGWISDGSLAGQTWVTVREALLGYVLGAVIGVAGAFVLLLFKRLGEVLSPLIGAVNAIPRLIFVPFFIIWFGLGSSSKVVFVAFVVVFFVFFNVYSGLQSIDPALVDNARTLGGGRAMLIRHLYIPAAFVWLIAGLRVSIGYAFAGALVGEFIGSTSGLGWLVLQGSSFYRTQDVIAALAIVVILVGIVDTLLRYIEARASVWRLNTQ